MASDRYMASDRQVSIHMIQHAVDPAGNPLMLHRDYVVSAKYGRALQLRGLARSTGAVYLERLMGLGVEGVTLAPGAGQMAKAAKDLGLSVTKGKERKAS